MTKNIKKERRYVTEGKEYVPCMRALFKDRRTRQKQERLLLWEWRAVDDRSNAAQAGLKETESGLLRFV